MITHVTEVARLSSIDKLTRVDNVSPLHVTATCYGSLACTHLRHENIVEISATNSWPALFSLQIF